MTPPPSPPLHTLVYRYFFFAWLFRDVNVRSPIERAAAWRHNVAEARWLPTYLRRWVVLAALLFSIAFATETWWNAPAWSALFYVPGSMAVSVIALICALILGFEALS